MEHGSQRYRCVGCGRTFNALTGTPLARLRKKECWASFANSLQQSHSVREAARQAGVAKNTSFRWRHRFLRLDKDTPKEQPKIEMPSARSYASMQLASIIIAEAARGGKKIPDNVWGSLTKLPGITINKGSFVVDGHGVVYSAILLTPDGGSKEVWARVATVSNKGEARSLEQKLRQSIADLERGAGPAAAAGGSNMPPPRDPPSEDTPAAKDEGPGDYEKDGAEGKRIVERINDEVVAVYGENKDMVTKMGKIGA